MRHITAAILCLLGLALASRPLQAREVLRFAPLPLLAEQHITRQFSGFCATLADISGREVTLVYKKNYAEIISSLAENTLDLAYIGPLPYVIATQTNKHITPLVGFLNREKKPGYTCALVAFGADQSPLDSECTMVALPQPYSTCGFMTTEALLQEYGLSLKSTPYTYTGNHENAALAVIRGNATMAGVKSSIARKYSNLGLKILKQSEPMPGFLLVGNSKTVDKELLTRMQNMLLELAQSSEAQNIQKSWGNMIKYGMYPAHDEDYDIVRELLQQYPIPERCL